MKRPKIISASNVFVEKFMSQVGLSLNTDQQLISEINSVWSNGFAGFINAHSNIPRVQGWEAPFDSHILRPHVYADQSKELRDICDTRAQEIISRNQPIKLFWSGGIDSTLVLCSILDNLKDHTQLTVFHTCESLVESPDFLEHLQKFNVDVRLWSDDWETLFDKNDLLISGTSSDQITGSVDESFFKEYNDWLYLPWEDYFIHRGISDTTIDVIKDKVNYPIQTTLEARWWFYYAIRHQFWVTLDWKLNLENGPGHNVMCFFDCYEFDAWSQVNRNNFFSGTNWKQYKQSFKDEIYRRWPNSEYRDNKTKENSSYNRLWIRRKNALFKQQYLFIYQSKDGIAKAYQPSYWPLIKIDSILEELKNLSYDF